MKTLLALGAGALAMYLMDRERGPQRRAQLRDQVERAKRAFGDFPEGRALGALGKARARGRAPRPALKLRAVAVGVAGDGPLDALPSGGQAIVPNRAPPPSAPWPARPRT